jgi:hypothetical protein
MFSATKDRDPRFIILTRTVLGLIFILAGFESQYQLVPLNIVPESADIYIERVTGGGNLSLSDYGYTNPSRCDGYGHGQTLKLMSEQGESIHHHELEQILASYYQGQALDE